MPYFERKPYLDNASADTVPQPPDVPITDLARHVLSGETRRKHHLDGPFACGSSTSPGGKAKITLEISANPDSGPVHMRFEAGDMVAKAGAAIPAGLIYVTPTEMHLLPGDSQELRIVTRVPDLLPAGQYTGRITGTGSEPTAIVVSFDVAEA